MFSTMSAAAIEEFKQKVLASADLQSQFSSAGNVDEFIETAVRIGAENGYSFTSDDVRTLLDSQQEDVQLSQEELSAVAGGYVSYGDSTLCGYCGSKSGTTSTKLTA
jgi:predicted ribosomally synthesized peptide with nif11-like leader